MNSVYQVILKYFTDLSDQYLPERIAQERRQVRKKSNYSKRYYIKGKGRKLSRIATKTARSVKIKNKLSVVASPVLLQSKALQIRF
jgi:hypothetical protein